MSDRSVREGTTADHAAVASVLDAAMLATAGLEEALADGRVLVVAEGERVLGALAYTPTDGGARVDAVAVRPGRRGRGIGSALVRAAVDRAAVLTAEFDPAVRPFYESLGFSIDRTADGRLRGVYRAGGFDGEKRQR